MKSTLLMLSILSLPLQLMAITLEKPKTACHCIPPQGPVGPEGPPGTPGTPGVGFLNTFGSFYSYSPLFLGPGDFYPFELVNSNVGVIHTPVGSSVQIIEPGNYFIIYGVIGSGDETGSSSCILENNGIDIPGTLQHISSGFEGDLFSLGIIVPLAANDVLRIRELEGTSAGGDDDSITVYLTLIKISD